MVFLTVEQSQEKTLQDVREALCNVKFGQVIIQITNGIPQYVDINERKRVS